MDDDDLIEKILEESIKNPNKSIENDNNNNLNSLEKYFLDDLKILPSFKSPFNFIDYYSYQKILLLQSIYSNNFLLNNLSLKIPTIEMKPFSLNEIENKNFYLFKILTSKIFICNKQEIFIFDLNEKTFIKKLFYNKKNNSFISAFDVDNENLLVGYENGTIIIFDIESGKTKIIIENIKNKILSLKIFKIEGKIIYFLVSDFLGNVYEISIKNWMFLLFKINEIKTLFNNNEKIYLIKNLCENFYVFLSLNKVLIYKNDENNNFIKIFEEFKPKNLNNENNLIDVDFGKGKLKNFIKNFIIISFDNFIYFYSINNKFEINYEGFYKNKNLILKIGFLEESIIYVLDNNLNLNIIDSFYINTNKNFNLENNNFCIKEENKFIESKLINFCPFDNNIKSYLNSFCVFNKNLFVFGEKNFYKINCLSFKEICDYLQRNNEYKKLLKLCVEVYNGNIKYLLLPEKNEIKKFIIQIISQFTLTNINNNNNNENIIEIIEIIIELCIKIECIEYLMNEIFPLLELKGYKNIFIIKLEKFILCDYLKDFLFDFNFIKNLIKLYLNNKKFENLSQILLHLNIKCLNNSEIISLMKRNYLINPLIYLLMYNDKYYEILEILLKYIKKGKMINNNNFNEILEKEKENIFYTKNYFIYKLFWYIKLCISGRKYPNNLNKISNYNLSILIPQITYFLLNENVMKILLIDYENYFSILKNIFTIETLFNFLNEADKNEKLRILAFVLLENDCYDFIEILPVNLLIYLMKILEKNNEKEIKLNLFIFITKCKNFNEIPKEFLINSSKFLIKNYENEEKINNCIKNLLSNENKFKKEDYEEILKNFNENDFFDVKFFLYDKINDFNNCLKIINKNEIKINKFEWINKTLLKLSEKKDLENFILFKDFILENLKLIAEINLIEFNNLIEKWFDKQIKKIIEKLLNLDKKILFDYLNLKIKKIEEEIEQNENNIIYEKEDEINFIYKTHFELLIELKKFDLILINLNKNVNFYPLIFCLKLCKKNNIIDAEIFILKKIGEFKESFEKCLEILCKNFNEIKNNFNNENAIKNFNKYFNTCLSICIDSSINNNEQKIWENFLIKLYEFLSEENNNKNLNEFLTNKIKFLLEKMCVYINIKVIMTIVSNNYKNAGLNEFKELLLNLLESYNNQEEIYKSTKNLLYFNVINNKKILINSNLKGNFFNFEFSFCSNCKNEFSNKNNVCYIFNCKHILCKKCVIKDYFNNEEINFCSICKENQIEDFNLNEDENNENSLIKKYSIKFINENINNEKIESNDKKQFLKRINKYENKINNKKNDFIENCVKCLRESIRNLEKTKDY